MTGHFVHVRSWAGRSFGDHRFTSHKGTISLVEPTNWAIVTRASAFSVAA
jgi:hypothetical protein